MPRYPFFAPFNFGRNYYNPQYSNRPYNNTTSNKYACNDNKQNGNMKNEQYNPFGKEHSNLKDMENSNFSCNKNCEGENRYYEQFFEVFGIKLYFDDLLILALLFFLYKEDSHDDYLYIILIMLLLG